MGWTPVATGRIHKPVRRLDTRHIERHKDRSRLQREVGRFPFNTCRASPTTIVEADLRGFETGAHFMSPLGRIGVNWFENRRSTLIPECDTEEDVRDVLRELCEEIFVEQLAGWFTDERTWPGERSFDVFCCWFDFQHHSMLVDLCDELLIDESVDRHFLFDFLGGQ